VSSERWFLSFLIVVHLVAISASAIPDPLLVEAIKSEEPVSGANERLTPVLDRFAATLTSVEADVFRFTTPLRALTRTYIQAGLRQKWDMFANPVRVDLYVRVAQSVASSQQPGRVRVFQELALPAQHEDEVRLTHKFRDKAVLNAFEALSANRRDQVEADPDAALKPIARYFRNRFRASYLTPDEMVVRTEVWLGTAPIPPKGERLSDSQMEERWRVLQRYWNGPVEEQFSSTTAQREADIVWTLEYAEKP
jgi:hypothetical protein